MFFMEITKALFGAGCFWGVEEYFKNVNGVKNTKVGYSGGKTENPTYEEVCSKDTEHAEVVFLEFDANIISYQEILNHFWKCHDPTQLNRQGPDIGTQYRSIIFYYSNEQKNIAENSKVNFQKKLSSEIKTIIEEAKDFYLAEEYHQCFIQKQKNI